MQIVTITNQKPVLSTFRTPGGPKMGAGNEKRFDDMLIRRAAEIPGPGQYDPRTDVNSNYYCDKFKNS
jgi:hypothetical protein